MFNTTQWDILIVDDEADVLTITKLVLQGIEVYGLPLVLHSAQSKAEAIDVLNNGLEQGINFAVAFVDIVMETDSAGLGLCHYIREEFGDRLVQLFIRTGQPGLAPEGTVIDQHEINGYFTKIEATEEKLYSLVKSGIRQNLWTQVAQMYISGLNEVLRSTDWRNQIERLIKSLVEDDTGKDSLAPSFVSFGQQTIVQRSCTDEQVSQWQAQFESTRGLRLSLEGNSYVRIHENLWGIRIVPADSSATVWLLCQTSFAPPDDLVTMTHDFLHGLASLWAKG